MDISEKIKELRKKTGLSQSKFSAKLTMIVSFLRFFYTKKRAERLSLPL